MKPEKLDTTLQVQKRFNRSREAGINPDHWYPVGWADQLVPGKVVRVTLWQRHIALFRGQDGALRAVQDACLHKGVALHKGEVVANQVVCPYHGWRFDGEGQCRHIPYLKDQQKYPKACLVSYPVQERYNMIWIYPGDPQKAAQSPLPEVPEYDDPDWLIVEIPAHFKVHFALVNENPLDTFHGHLHRDLQGWYNPVLTHLERDQHAVRATYEVTFRNSRLARFIGLTEGRQAEVQRTIEVGFHYPHCRNSMPGKSNYYFMRQPVGPQETRSYALLCLKVRLPRWLVATIRRPLAAIFHRFMVKPFLDQDIEVMESEQETYGHNKNRAYVEINPVIAAVQSLIVAQEDQYLQTAKE